MYVSGPFIQHEPYPGTEVFRWGVKGAADARAKVRKLADGGVDVIKLIDQDQMTLEEVKAVVDEAHRRNLPVVAHAHRPEEIRRGLAAGVDNFEHTGLATAPEYPDDIIKAIRERAANMAWVRSSGRRRSRVSSTTNTSATTPSTSTTPRGTTACRRPSSTTSGSR